MNKRKRGVLTSFQKIRKRGPFDLSVVKDDYPFLSYLLVRAISQLDELPDFSEDDKVAGERGRIYFHYSKHPLLAIAACREGPKSTHCSPL